MKQLFTLELATEFYQMTRNLKLPAHLKTQYVRACSSVALNLAEGSAKLTLADRRKFYFISLGRFRECETILKPHQYNDPIVMSKVHFLGACLFRHCHAVK